jgi:hypothetical protein
VSDGPGSAIGAIVFFGLSLPGHACGAGSHGLRNLRFEIREENMPNLFVIYTALFLAVYFGVMDFLIQTA